MHFLILVTAFCREGSAIGSFSAGRTRKSFFCVQAKRALSRKEIIMKAKKFAADEMAEGVRINKYLADAGV